MGTKHRIGAEVLQSGHSRGGLSADTRQQMQPQHQPGASGTGRPFPAAQLTPAHLLCGQGGARAVLSLPGTPRAV